MNLSNLSCELILFGIQNSNDCENLNKIGLVVMKTYSGLIFIDWRVRRFFYKFLKNQTRYQKSNKQDSMDEFQKLL